ncbi:Protein of unknown function [Saccharopolyspora kobensis]|uniref:DUF3558 domain-containing protein n=1 Tax=Saccharopolyspora kobensis TaxID=146035 RepID=A0A1H6BPP8_9PSEU|nr:DUF3558 domain-containing protein [Saccharopolyspora kobensis]SEG62678.1 Protein of unknown function [Saccharopolyspora kobensis]SFE84236.1 Protein of unknown function [Saccharopolyspora kobensis]
MSVSSRVRRSGGLLGLTAAALLVAGCTVNGPDPVPAGESTPAGETSAETAFPKRPAELPVAGAQDAEICTWLTGQQMAQLKVARPSPVIKNGNNYNGCGYSSDGTWANAGVSLRVVPEPLEVFAAKLNSSEVSRKTFEINGFGALQSQIAGAERLGCSVFVDVAQGQTLYAELSLLSVGEMDNEQMCEKAAQAAGAAVTSLQAKG